MAKVSATVVQSEQGLVIEAARQSSCAGCTQKNSCASQWQIDDSAFVMPAPDQKSFKPGDKVSLECSEKTLLHYFTLLFLPSLGLLLLSNTVASLFFNINSPLQQTVMQVLLPLLGGAFISKRALAKAKKGLLAGQRLSRL